VDGTVQLWDLERSIPTFNARHFNPPIVALTYSPDGRFLILQTLGWVEVRRTSDGSLRSRQRADTFAVSPVENLMALGAEDGSVLVQDIETGQAIHRMEAHTGRVYALAFSPDGQALTSSGEDCAVRHWDARTGAFLHDFEENVTNAYQEENTESRIFVYYMEHVAGTGQLIGYGSWGRVVNWDVNSGETRYFIEPEALEYYQGMMTLNPHFPESFGVDTESRRFYLGGTGYDVETGERVGEYQPPAGLPASCAPNGPLSADGELLFTIGYEHREGQICILDAEDLHLVQAVEVIPRSGIRYVIMDWIYLSPDGTQLIANSSSGTVHVYGIAR
jgi:WD40 repeat protein